MCKFYGSKWREDKTQHHATGIGRTGTFCAVDIALRRLHTIMADKVRPAAAKQAVDLKFIVQSLRRQRQGMVQTKSQYLFCHQVHPLLLILLLGIVTGILLFHVNAAFTLS